MKLQRIAHLAVLSSLAFTCTSCELALAVLQEMGKNQSSSSYSPGSASTSSRSMEQVYRDVADAEAQARRNIEAAKQERARERASAPIASQGRSQSRHAHEANTSNAPTSGRRPIELPPSTDWSTWKEDVPGATAIHTSWRWRRQGVTVFFQVRSKQVTDWDCVYRWTARLPVEHRNGGQALRTTSPPYTFRLRSGATLDFTWHDPLGTGEPPKYISMANTAPGVKATKVRE